MRHFQQWQWCYRKNITTQVNGESLRIFFPQQSRVCLFFSAGKIALFCSYYHCQCLDTYRANSWMHITAHSLGLSKSILGNVGNWRWIALERERAHCMKVKCTLHHQISPGMYRRGLRDVGQLRVKSQVGMKCVDRTHLGFTSDNSFDTLKYNLRKVTWPGSYRFKIFLCAFGQRWSSKATKATLFLPNQVTVHSRVSMSWLPWIQCPSLN